MARVLSVAGVMFCMFKATTAALEEPATAKAKRPKPSVSMAKQSAQEEEEKHPQNAVSMAEEESSLASYQTMMAEMVTKLGPLDTNDDGKLSRQELFAVDADGEQVPKDVLDMFDKQMLKIDTDKDGLLNPGEMPSMMAALAMLGPDKAAGAGLLETDEEEEEFGDYDAAEGTELSQEHEEESEVQHNDKEQEASSYTTAIVQQKVAQLLRFDANGDGKVSKAELFRPFMGESPPPAILAQFDGVLEKVDANKDGEINVAEMPLMLQAYDKLIMQEAAAKTAGGR